MGLASVVGSVVTVMMMGTAAGATAGEPAGKAAGVGSGPALGQGPMEARLESAYGHPVELAETRGQPVILFFEDRDSLGLNQGLKDDLFQRGQEKDLLRSVRVVAVANLQPFNFFPARQIALAFVRDAQGKVNLPIWVDWQAVLSRAPWNLPPRSSSVVLLDAQGRVVFQRTGRLSQDERNQFFDALARLLAP